MGRRNAIKSIDQIIIKYAAVLAIMAIILITSLSLWPKDDFIRIEPGKLVGSSFMQDCAAAEYMLDTYTKKYHEHFNRYKSSKGVLDYQYYLAFLENALQQSEVVKHCAAE